MVPSSKTGKSILDDPPVIAIDRDSIIKQQAIETQFIAAASNLEIDEDSTLYLSLILSANNQVLIPSHQVIEILSIAPTQITPIPQVENLIMGIYSWRGEVLWVVDGAALLGDVALCDRHFWNSRYSIFVIRESAEHIGIMVPDVGNLGKRSRFCTPTAPPLAQSIQTQSIQTLTCPPIVDLVDRISQLRHQLRATWN
jgi:chemotaxis signal transduction protein